MSDKHDDERKIFLIAILAAVIISSFVIGSQFVQPSLSQGLLKQGQLAGFNATGNQTANQSAGLGDPAKMYVPSQPVD
jgi:ribose/xylose/arabinose/galactoside ABC-type transport system permease subunit